MVEFIVMNLLNGAHWNVCQCVSSELKFCDFGDLMICRTNKEKWGAYYYLPTSQLAVVVLFEYIKLATVCLVGTIQQVVAS